MYIGALFKPLVLPIVFMLALMRLTNMEYSF